MGTTSSKSGTPGIEGQILFKSKKGNVFKIPAIYYNENEKKLYAFAEKRTSQDNFDVVALVMRTGKVNAKSEVKWSKAKVLVKKCPCGFRPMNPCVVYEKHTETMFLFFNYVNEKESWQIEHRQNRARLRYITKKNNDDKWSKFTEVTELQSMFKNWTTFAIGAGHGIQTKSGRMIIPAYAYSNDRPPIPHAFCFYSDDDGSTWKCEKMLSKMSMECKVTEILQSNRRDSLIYCSARSFGGHRVQDKIDENGGNTLTTVTPLEELDMSCQGSVISFPAQSGDANTSDEKWLLFSHPTKQKSDLERFDLGVYVNTSPVNSKGKYSRKWSQPWVINHGHSGYSDLAYIEDGWFACLMECGEKSFTDKIACRVFSYEDVLRGIPDLRT